MPGPTPAGRGQGDHRTPVRGIQSTPSGRRPGVADPGGVCRHVENRRVGPFPGRIVCCVGGRIATPTGDTTRELTSTRFSHRL